MEVGLHAIIHLEVCSLLRISLYTYLTFSSFAVMAFYFPLYFQHKGLGNGEIGIVMGLGSFIAIFAQPFWGYVSDRLKTVKRVLATIMIAAALISIPLYLSTTFAQAMLLMIGFMFFFSAIGPLTESLIVNFSFEHKRNYGSIRLWGEVGVGTAALWMGFTIEEAGIGILGWLFGGVVILSLISMFWLSDAKPNAVPVTKESLKKLFTNRTFLLFLGIILFIGTPHRMNDTFLPLYLKELGAQESDVGIAWLVATLSSVPTMAFIGILLRKRSELFFITLAALCYTLRWIIYSFTGDPMIITIAQAMHMLTFPVMLVSSVHFIHKIVPRELIATGQTVFTAIFFGFGGIMGSSIGGWVMDAFGPQVLYLAGAILSLIGGIAIYIMRPYLQTAKHANPEPAH